MCEVGLPSTMHEGRQGSESTRSAALPDAKLPHVANLLLTTGCCRQHMRGTVLTGGFKACCAPIAETLPRMTGLCAVIAEQAVLHDRQGASRDLLLRLTLPLVPVLPSTTALLHGLVHGS